MPSPFPGMNPFLEHADAWHNFHEQFPGRVVEVLEPQVGPNYFLKVDEHIYFHERGPLSVVDRIGLSHVEIHDRRSRRLVTVIELLSPSDKLPGPDREQYASIRANILVRPTHLVEIDLLRIGQRVSFEGHLECHYCMCISRYHQRPRVEVWPIKLRDPLPTIRIPLLGSDPGPSLDLQAILNHLYDAGGYGKFIYDTPPDPPLSAEDAEWANSLVTQLKS